MGVYVRADKKKGRSYYWLVESHREGKRVVQKRIKYLGLSPPPPALLEKLKQEHSEVIETAKIIAEVSQKLGEAMPGLDIKHSERR